MRKMNRHERLRRHKNKTKQKFGIWFNGNATNIKLIEEHTKSFCYFSATPPNDGFDYWKTLYLSGKRKFAKRCSNSIIRARYRDILKNIDIENIEDIPALCGSEYRRLFDYNWTIW